MSNKVFVLGLDGATFDLIEPWAREGRLPAFKRLMDEGSWGTLWCPIPPISAQSWASFATGKNPGKHGLIDFMEATPYSYSTRFVNSRMRAGKSFWRLLSEAGKTVGVLNVPMTYPPESVNGFVVGGCLSPSRSSQFVSPAELRKELLGAVPGYIIECADIELPRLTRADRRTAFVERVLAMMEGRIAATRWLYDKFRPDLFIAAFTAFDRICHYFWKYMDPAVRGRFPQKDVERYGDAILRVYQRQDEILAEILEMIEPGTTVFLMSDHGFGSSYERLNIPGWMVEQGYITPLRRKKGLLSKAIDSVIGGVVRFTPFGFRMFIKDRFPKLAAKAVSRVYFEGIDWSRTRAYTIGEFRSIYINLKGRQPNGIVEPGAEYEALRDELIGKFRALHDPTTGEPLVQNVYRREEVYSGEYVAKLPDLIIDWHYRYSFATDFSKGGLVSSILDTKRLHWDKSGYHRPNGIFMAYGKDIRAGARVEGVVMDATATILYELGMAVPADMDGRVIVDAYERARIERDPPRTSDVDTSSAPADSPGYTDDESARVAEQLKGLGYLE